MKLSFPLIYHLLKSDTLNVPDENMVLSFLFNYHSDALDILQNCIRFGFIDLSKALSALRQSEKFGKSSAFVENLRREMARRVAPLDQ